MKKLWAKIVYSEIHDYQKVLHWYEKFGYNFYYYYLKLRMFLTKKYIPMNFVYLTNTQCTLQCKECHSYMPYYTKDMHYMTNFESFKKEIDTLLRYVDIIPNFRLQGGETLLTKDLAEIIKYACNKKQIQHIQVITNGTLLPSDELLEAMSNPKILFSISDYSCNKSLISKLKYDEIKNLSKRKGVNTKHWLTQAGTLWIGRNTIDYKNNDNIEFAKKNLEACHCFNHPKVFIYYRGKLHICPPSVFFTYKNLEFQLPEDEIIDIVNTPKNLLDKKINKFFKKKYYKLCANCNAYANKDITSQPAEQLN